MGYFLTLREVSGWGGGEGGSQLSRLLDGPMEQCMAPAGIDDPAFFLPK